MFIIVRMILSRTSLTRPGRINQIIYTKQKKAPGWAADKDKPPPPKMGESQIIKPLLRDLRDMNMEEEEGTNRTNRNVGVTRRKDTRPPLTRLDGRSSASRRHRPRPEGAVEAA